MKATTTNFDAQEWRVAFDFFDRDRDGVISAQELFDCLTTLGQNVSRSDVLKMMREASCAHGEALDFKHFTEYIHSSSSSSRSISRSGFRAIFNAIDVDLAGYLTAAKIRHFLTLINVDMNDEEMSEMVSLHDMDGDNKISPTDFEAMIESMGYMVGDDEITHELHKSLSRPKNETKLTDKSEGAEMIALEDLPENIRAAIGLFDLSETGYVSLPDLKQAAKLLKKSNARDSEGPEPDEHLHWDPSREKRGLGDLIHKVNHVAIIVSDVGRSAKFYSDVLGLQPIRRPNFDKHGAWFTMGNIELHLIKGKPLVHSGDDLIVNHISLETFNINDVPARLQELGVPFRQNVSVPKSSDGGGDGRTNADKDSAHIVQQIFLQDPDGYYIEICNCMILDEYSLGKRDMLAGYDGSMKQLDLKDASVAVPMMHRWAQHGKNGVQNRGDTLRAMASNTMSIAEIGRLLGCKKVARASPDLVRKFAVRKTVYGDICQSFSQQQLEEIATVSGNDPAIAFKVMHLKVGVDGIRHLQPPAFYESGETMIIPPRITL